MNAAPTPGQVAKAVLDLAAEVDRVECAIKHEILRAAAQGDVDRIKRLVDRWLRLAPAEVLEADQGADQGQALDLQQTR